jgi:hypothetical protein
LASKSIDLDANKVASQLADGPPELMGVMTQVARKYIHKEEPVASDDASGEESAEPKKKSKGEDSNPEPTDE